MSDELFINPNQYGRWDDSAEDVDWRKLSSMSIDQLKQLAANMPNPERIDVDGNFVHERSAEPVFGLASERDNSEVDEDVFSAARDSDKHYGR